MYHFALGAYATVAFYLVLVFGHMGENMLNFISWWQFLQQYDSVLQTQNSIVRLFHGTEIKGVLSDEINKIEFMAKISVLGSRMGIIPGTPVA